MTRKEILAMKPGRELDKAVALAVMGWREVEHRARPLHTRAVVDGTDEVLSHDDWDNKGPHPRLVSPEGNEVFLCSCGDPFLDGLPHYSTDFAAAWEVVERLLMRGEKLSIYCDPDAPGPDLAESDRFTVAWPVGESISARTAPEAICKAALLAMEEQPMG